MEGSTQAIKQVCSMITLRSETICLLAQGSLDLENNSTAQFPFLVGGSEQKPDSRQIDQLGSQVDARCLWCNTNQESREHLFFSCNYSFDLCQLVARRIQLLSHRDWQTTLDQMTSLPLLSPQNNLALLVWQAAMYWLWTERNVRLHANTFRSGDQIFRLLDRQLRNKIFSFRETNLTRSSIMLQSWLRFG